MERFRIIAWRGGDLRLLFLALVLAIFLVSITIVLYVAFTVVRVDGDSMAPVLLDNDRVLLTHGYTTPRAGDVIGFDATDTDGQEVRLLKRVIAVPGDYVVVIGDIAYVNGTASLAAPTAIVSQSALRFPPLTIPEGAVYVMGDNRPISLDSRFIGPVPIDSIEGKAVTIILPIERAGTID